MNRLLKWNSQRQFGLEYEFTNRSNDLNRMAEIVYSLTNQSATVRNYGHTHGNHDRWECKPDSSCGTELVSPILKGPAALKIAAEILPGLQSADFCFGTTCGQHVHVEIADFSSEQAGILAAYWMKVERFILNGTPVHRRQNQYCKLLTHFNSNINPTQQYAPTHVFTSMTRGRNAINFQNWNATSGGTVEFRFGEMTFDPEVIKNRVRFLIWLVEMCKILPPPQNLKWMTPKETLSIFNLWDDPTSMIKYQYSPAVQSMRKWMLARLIEHAPPAFHRDVDRCRVMLEEIEHVELAQTSEDEV